MVVGGVPFDHETGPVGHSDADVLLHAVTDALLGALGLADIGELFPDDDPVNEGADSARFVREAVRLVHEDGWVVGNLDTTVVLERPHLSPLKDQIRENLAQLLDVHASRVNVKGKSHEGVDAVGSGEAIMAQAVVLLTRL